MNKGQLAPQSEIVLQIPPKFLTMEIVEDTQFRKVVKYEYWDRDIYAYYAPKDAPDGMGGKLLALKHVQVVRIFDTLRCPGYAFVQCYTGLTFLELYQSFNADLLRKLISAHYPPDTSLSDCSISPASPYTVLDSLYQKDLPAVIIFFGYEDKGKSGLPIEIGKKLPIPDEHFR